MPLTGPRQSPSEFVAASLLCRYHERVIQSYLDLLIRDVAKEIILAPRLSKS